jgi:class 3 adenylate cyclase
MPCGSQIVAGDARRTASRIEGLARGNGVEVCVAYDGLALPLA